MFHKLLLVLVVASIVVILNAQQTDEEKFEEFKKKFNKQYSSPEEEQTRFQNFKKNLNHIQEHNKKYENGEVTHFEGINQFSDLNEEEFANRNHGLKPQ